MWEKKNEIINITREFSFYDLIFLPNNKNQKIFSRASRIMTFEFKATSQIFLIIINI